MTAATLALTDFLLARIAEDEERARQELWSDRNWGLPLPIGERAKHANRVLAECEAKRRIVEFHRSWPVLTETPLTFAQVDSSDPSAIALRASRQIQWQTEQEYRERFGTEPPSSPIIRALAAIYADHPDYRDEWRP